MLTHLTASQARWLRLQAQGLVGQSDASVAEVVRAVGGVQAQEMPAAALSVGARLAGLVAADVDRARVAQRSIVRTWLMRGTLHLVASDDLEWLLPLFGPLFAAANRRRRLELGLDDETSARGVSALHAVLAEHGPLTRHVIADLLAERRLTLVGQARIHLIAYAAQIGVVCQGPDDGTEPTYTLLADWLDYTPRAPDNTTLAELARRYLSAFGPATPEDMAAWSGLPLRDARRAWTALAGELLEVTLDGAAAWLLKSQAPRLDEDRDTPPTMRLLPAYDTLLLGYRDRRWLVEADHEKRVHPGGGMIHPTLLADNRLVGTWRIQRQKRGLTVAVTPFDTLDPNLEPYLAAEVADIGRFYGVDGRFTIQE